MAETVYIAGPMRGIPLFNFPAFDRAADVLRSHCHYPINPADLDRKIGFDPKNLPVDYDWKNLDAIGFRIRDAAKRDLMAILTTRLQFCCCQDGSGLRGQGPSDRLRNGLA